MPNPTWVAIRQRAVLEFLRRTVAGNEWEDWPVEGRYKHSPKSITSYCAWEPRLGIEVMIWWDQDGHGHSARHRIHPLEKVA